MTLLRIKIQNLKKQLNLLRKEFGLLETNWAKLKAERKDSKNQTELLIWKQKPN